jgi:hypothetical protein
MKLWCAAALAAVLCGCAAPPKVDRNTPYEGNVSPLEYRHVSGAPVRRNATAEVIGAAAGGVGYAAGGAAMGAPVDTTQATQYAVQSSQDAARRGAAAAPACAPAGAGSRP